MGESKTQFLESIDNLLTKQVPWQVYLFAIVIVGVFAVTSIYDYTTQEEPMNFKININDYNGYDEKTNTYIGLFKLGLLPNAEPRQPQINDIDTGIKLTDGDNIYALVESRTWATKDYGRNFLIKIN